MADVTTDKIVSQLRALLQLTESEIQLATVRRTQARTDAVQRELTENAQNSQDRSQQIRDALTSLGGVPDVLSPSAGAADCGGQEWCRAGPAAPRGAFG